MLILLRFTSLTLVLLALVAAANVAVCDDTTVVFNRDIRPILSDNCFACHGPDEKTRQGGLRLDLAEAARTKLDSGRTAITPGNLNESELVRRISSQDPNDRMPPMDSGKRLTASQIDILNRWITSGAEYQRHWSFVAPHKPAVPQATIATHGPIDAFIIDRLRRENLAASPSVDKERFIRRVTLDLNGTPPTLIEIDSFLADSSPDAAEKLIDRLMASPRYGERMALDWLDAAQYADTHGFNNDTTRSMWHRATGRSMPSTPGCSFLTSL